MFSIVYTVISRSFRAACSNLTYFLHCFPQPVPQLSSPKRSAASHCSAQFSEFPQIFLIFQAVSPVHFQGSFPRFSHFPGSFPRFFSFSGQFPQIFPIFWAVSPWRRAPGAGHPGVAHLAQRGAHGAQGAARAAPQGAETHQNIIVI